MCAYVVGRNRDAAKSLYQADYPGWTAQRPARRARESVPADVPFESVTSYTADFHKRSTRRSKPAQLVRACCSSSLGVF